MHLLIIYLTIKEKIDGINAKNFHNLKQTLINLD